MLKIFIIVLIIYEISLISYSLKIHSSDVPTFAHIGDRIWLNCSYDLESDDFDSLKWYKDGEEFYRMSAIDNRKRTFDLPGIRVHVSLTMSRISLIVRLYLVTNSVKPIKKWRRITIHSRQTSSRFIFVS